MTEITYAGGRGAPVRVAPLDPDAVLVVTLNIDDWLRGEVLVGQDWQPPADLVVGDGVASKTIGTGSSIVPTVPISFTDPEDGKIKIQASVWLDDAVTDYELGVDYEIRIALETAAPRGDFRTVITELRAR